MALSIKTLQKRLTPSYTNLKLEKDSNKYIYLYYQLFIKKLCNAAHGRAFKRKSIIATADDIETVGKKVCKEFSYTYRESKSLRHRSSSSGTTTASSSSGNAESDSNSSSSGNISKKKPAFSLAKSTPRADSSHAGKKVITGGKMKTSGLEKNLGRKKKVAPLGKKVAPSVRKVAPLRNKVATMSVADTSAADSSFGRSHAAVDDDVWSSEESLGDEDKENQESSFEKDDNADNEYNDIDEDNEVDEENEDSNDDEDSDDDEQE